jgi:hypothetical protein
MKTRICKSGEITRRVALCGREAISIGGQVLTPDLTRAYMECELAHAFPVVTVDNTALHPQVVANSYHSMLHKVLDLGHLIVAYNPDENARDRVLGTVIAVEFPANEEHRTSNIEHRTSNGEWTVQSERSKAPGIRAVSVIHRQLEDAEEIIQLQKAGKLQWAVSMEDKYDEDECGFCICGRREVEKWEESTPEDLRTLGFTYVPYLEAPDELKSCFDLKNTKISADWKKQETIMLLGGLNGSVHFMGIGLTPLGKEKEARVTQMLASGIAFAEVDGEAIPELLAPLKRLSALRHQLP